MLIHNFLKKLVQPTSKSEDKARSEFILNVLLLASLGLSLMVLAMNLVRIWLDLGNAIHIGITFVILFFFIILYFLSHKGYARVSSFLLLIIFFLLVSSMEYKWGVDIPMAILSYALIIFMAGILIDTRFSFLVTLTISSTIAVIAYLQNVKIIEINRYWINDVWSITDIVVASTIFLIIATVSWLSNREIEKSLTRARRSEADLKKERDLLEITVEARTRELKETQAEKMTQLYRFAEFGRLSSGLFHDLINPLTAVSLNIEKVKNAGETKQYVDKAIAAAKKMEDMVSTVRKQLSRQESKTLFSLNVEVNQAIEVLSHKAMKANMALYFPRGEDIRTYGDPVKFNQVMLNLLANAIDAGGRTAHVFLGREKGMIVLSVKDDGTGIPEENKQKIFEPFFTTKTEERGMGIGLSITKRIIEKDFGGSIKVASKEGKGSVFTVKFPQKQNE